MPLTPADTQKTLSDELSERIEDALDDVVFYARQNPLAVAGLGLVLGFLTTRAVLARIA